MSESEYQGTIRPSAVAYISQPKPYLKDSEQRTLYREVEICNKKLHSKIQAIKKGASDVSKQISHGGYTADHYSINRQKEQREIRIENERISKKLHETYESKRISLYGQHPEMGHTINCNERWEGRTSIYTPPTSKSRPMSAKSSITSNISPTLGVAICSGCGVKSFAGADGPKLFPCSVCHKVWYCTPTCQSLDLQSHKMLCKYESSPHKGSPMSLVRPSADYWVNNQSMAIARHELNQRAARQVVLTPEEEVEERARVAKLVAKAKEKEDRLAQAQAKIEWLAQNNMDGPRPCCYMNGKRI